MIFKVIGQGNQIKFLVERICHALRCPCLYIDLIIYMKVCADRSSLTPPLFIDVPALYHVRKVSGFVFVCWGYRFCLFLWVFYRILELFLQCWYFLFLILTPVFQYLRYLKIVIVDYARFLFTEYWNNMSLQ